MEKPKLAKAFLVLMSLWFYAYFKPIYLPIIVGSICVNFGFSKLLRSEKYHKKSIFILGIVFNIALIFVFKYLDFTVSNINALFKSNLPLQHIIMPLGISFFTFQQIGYLVDVWNEETAEHDFLEYSLFVSYFPQLIAGPIVSLSEMLPQFKDEAKRRFDWDSFTDGIYIFSAGLAKKVLLADTLGKMVDYTYPLYETLTGPEVIAAGVLYTLQLYFDFSGYCDMAFGLARMFNFTLPINFNSPLKALSIQEYWDKWHITLGRFLEKYVFMPIAFSTPGMKLNAYEKKKGVKKPQTWTVITMILTFLISGIWHGANWTFILWGVLHGFVRAYQHIVRKKRNKLPKALRWITNTAFVVLAMALFRADSLTQFFTMLGRLGTGWGDGIRIGILNCFDVMELVYIEKHIPALFVLSRKAPWINMALISALAAFIALVPKNLHEKPIKKNVLSAIGIFILFAWSLVSLSNMATFLYFNF
ncbi:MAG: MBOAT family protein [Lachnospiraceae bacterium]|nr:MBOAT family protein [Lachnospiraceae bacterium]